MKYGFRHTDETRARMSKSLKALWGDPVFRTRMNQISVNNKRFLGHHHTEEQKAKISKAMLGRVITEEHRVNLSNALIGRAHTEETKAKLSEIVKTQWQNPEYRARMCKSRVGMIATKEARANMSKSQMGRTHTKDTKAKMSKAQRTQWQDPEYRAIWEERWQSPEYRDRVIKAMRLGCLVHPNKPETILLALLDSAYPGEWEFVGDGQLIIAGKNPDFFNINSKKQIIELWGDWWHRGQNPQERIDIFKHYGYSTLIIWENELREPEKVLEKIARMEG